MPEGTFDERRAAIVAAALQVFSAQGYSKASNREIARAAGVTAAALYWYFPSKEALFQAVVAEQRGVLAQVSSLLDLMKDLPPRDALTRIARSIASLVSDEPSQQFARLCLAEAVHNPLIASVLELDLMEPLVGLVRGYLAHQMQQGRLRQADPQVAADLFVSGLVTTLLMQSTLQHRRLQGVPADQLAETAADLLLQGLAHQGT